MIREIVTDPEGYFEERVKYPTVRIQLVIVVLAGLAANVWRPAIIQELGGASMYVDDVLLIFTIAGVIEFLLWWAILTVLMAFIVNQLGGDARVAELFRLSGYGFLPMILGGIIWSGGYYWVLQGVPSPDAPRQAGFQYEYESYAEFFEAGAGDPLLLAILAVGSIFVLASGYLWLIGVKVAGQVDRNEAVLAVAPAVALFLLMTFFRPF